MIHQDTCGGFGGFKKKLGFIERAFQDGIIDNKRVEFLNVEFPTIPFVYALPKVYKSVPTRRPII